MFRKLLTVDYFEVSRLGLLQDLRSLPSLDPDESLLIIAIRLLICGIKGALDVRAKIYAGAKQCYCYLESSGVITFKVLQAVLLITYYEVSNGIYPAAYLTIGTCARVGQALGLHDRREAPQMYPTTGKHLSAVISLTLHSMQAPGRTLKRCGELGGVS